MKKGLIVLGIVVVVIVAGVIVFSMSKNNSNLNENREQSAEQTVDEGFSFVLYNGQEVKIGDEFSKEKFGEENEYSEIASCAFEGLDKTYKYEHYEITTYPDGDKDKVFTIYFLDEVATTKEGVKISDSYDQMVAAYSDNYKKEENMYTYTKGNTQLKFIVESDTITSIEYTLLMDV